MIGGRPCDDGITLLPLKEERCPGNQRAHRRRESALEWDAGALRRVRRDDDGQEVQPTAEATVGSARPFEESCEWRWTREVCTGLFRAFGRYYDEKWFPTVVREWCLLYYQSTHSTDYWQARDEFLAGDEEIRMAVWSSILCERQKNNKRLEELRRQRAVCADLEDEIVDEDEAQKVVELRGAINEGKDLIGVKRMAAEELSADNCPTAPVPSEEERAEAELLEAELRIADPDDNPDWVEMRRKMRGSFAALNMARCTVSHELLDHVMIELCKYWANAPPLDPCAAVDSLLERNIMREIQSFRFKLFNVTLDCEPQRRAADDDQPSCPCPESEPEPEPEQESEAEQDNACGGCTREQTPLSPPSPKSDKQRPKSQGNCCKPAAVRKQQCRR